MNDVTFKSTELGFAAQTATQGKATTVGMVVSISFDYCLLIVL